MLHRNYKQTQDYTRIDDDVSSTSPSVSLKTVQLRNVASPDLSTARSLTTRAQVLNSLMPLGRYPSSSISTLINNPQAPPHFHDQQSPPTTPASSLQSSSSSSMSLTSQK
ncbi:unnamed protein product [Mortierella alpina]